MKQDESSKERKEKRIMKKNNGLSKVFLGKGFFHMEEKMVAVVEGIETPVFCHGSFGSYLIVSSTHWTNGGLRTIEEDCVVKGLAHQTILDFHGKRKTVESIVSDESESDYIPGYDDGECDYYEEDMCGEEDFA